jgi:hypothetical protein
MAHYFSRVTSVASVASVAGVTPLVDTLKPRWLTVSRVSRVSSVSGVSLVSDTFVSSLLSVFQAWLVNYQGGGKPHPYILMLKIETGGGCLLPAKGINRGLPTIIHRPCCFKSNKSNKCFRCYSCG